MSMACTGFASAATPMFTISSLPTPMSAGTEQKCASATGACTPGRVTTVATDNSARMNRMRRIVVTVAIAAAIVIAGATPAWAHTVAGTGATNYKTTLKSVSPTLPGLHLKVIEAGSRIELKYTGTKTIYVLGYVDEQYLRIDKRGVFENLNSPATYINKTRTGTTNPPDNVDPRKKPEWQKVSGGQVARW